MMGEVQSCQKNAKAAPLPSESGSIFLLADIGLSGDIDAIEVAARARDRCSGIPTVFLTAYSDGDTMRPARITEPYGYLLKLAEQELHSTIEIALQQKSTAQTLQRTREELTAITERLFQVQEEERRAIARELHDDIGQRIASLQFEYEQLWRKLPQDIRQQDYREF